ncbi:MAG: ribbon-helix-helix domain-containing protein [Prevotellaceae bacterium]|jgi:metal-responsive CopG/Arc/MetJ family transcriptional regulator|nr:ribbon-helix-helix domain-containing protein [Prevotellaceae bacterium]
MKKQQHISTGRRKRVHRKTITFNTEEYNFIDNFCKKYGIKNRSKFFRESIVRNILQELEQDHPKLF